MTTPSDYQSALKSLLDPNPLAKAEALKRLNVWVASDKKQFASYSKRIVLSLQEALLQPREDVSLLACTLTLQLIQLNPRDIEFYVRSKLLKTMVINLGDTRPQIRKTSHYCLLAYIRTFKNFDDLIQIYMGNGMASVEWQLRQKAINSLQSILIMEMRYVNWASGEFLRMTELLLAKLRDQNAYVQKASEQCLLSLCKMDQMKLLSKKLSSNSYLTLKTFMETQLSIGNLTDLKLQIKEEPKKPEILKSVTPKLAVLSNSVSTKAQIKQETKIVMPPIVETERYTLRKAESILNVNALKQMRMTQQLRKIEEVKRRDVSFTKQEPIHTSKQIEHSERSMELRHSEHKQVTREVVKQQREIEEEHTLPSINGKQQKMELVMDRKLLQDLKNEKDWKTRLEAVEELQTKFSMYKEQLPIDILTKSFLPVLVKLLGDPNFKVALVSLKIIEEILSVENISLEHIVPQIVERLSDNKVALRQNITKLIKAQYLSSKKDIWLDMLLLQLRRASNSNIKQEILNALSKLYEQDIGYPCERVVDAVCPLMDDLKTKIKIKTLDLLVTVTVKTQKVDRIKMLLASKINQVYYQMYLEKISKELRLTKPEETKIVDRQVQSIVANTLANNTANTLGNTVGAVESKQLERHKSKMVNSTSTSLQRYPSSLNSTMKTSFYKGESEGESEVKILSTKHIVRKRYTSRQSELTTNNSQDATIPPFADPAKELKSILTEVKSEDWQVGFEAINRLRRVVYNHVELLSVSILRQLVPDIMRLAESLRSSLSKNAVILVHELSEKVKRGLDVDLDLIFSKLIKKTLDANSFISEEVKKALVTVCSNCNESRVLALLMSSHTSRALAVKAVVVHILEQITFIPRVYDKELQKIVTICVDFMSEGSLEVRENTKRLLNSILNSQKGPTVIKMIPTEIRSKLKREEKIVVTPVGVIPLPKEEIEEAPKRKKRNKITSFPEQFTGVEGWLENCESGDWKLRLESMTSIGDLISRFPEETGQHRCSSRVMDVLSKQINDPNIKVAQNALKIFIQVGEKVPFLLENSLSVIMNQVFNCFSANKPEIRQLADELYECVCRHLQKWMLVQHLCNGCLYAMQKSKITILDKLANLVRDIPKSRQSILGRNVYPMVNKLAEEGRVELMGPLKELIFILQEVDPDCMDSFKSKAHQLLQ